MLLIALGLSVPQKAFRHALICTVGSVLGGILGYILGWQFWWIAKGILFKYIDQSTFEAVKSYFIKYEAWAVGIAGFTPVTYKVFTISAGFFQANFWVFVIASIISRGARFFLVSTLIYHYGSPIRIFIDKYFNVLTYAFTLLLIGGFFIIRYII